MRQSFLGEGTESNRFLFGARGRRVGRRITEKGFERRTTVPQLMGEGEG